MRSSTLTGALRGAGWEGVLVLLVGLAVVLGAALSPHFLTGSNFSFLLADQTEIAMIAAPLTLLVVAGEIDISVASMLGLSSAVVGALWNHGWAMEAIIPIVVLIGALAGTLNGLLVTRLGLSSVAVSIGALTLYRGLAFVVLGDGTATNFPSAYTNFGFAHIPGLVIPYVLIPVLVVAIASGVLLHSTAFGRSIFAVGANREMALYSGIRVKRVKLTLFALTGASAAGAGVLDTLRLASARADNGVGLELPIIAVVVLGGVAIFGGKGSVIGVMLATLLLGIITNALALRNISDNITTVITGSLLIMSVLVPTCGSRFHDAHLRRADRRAYRRTVRLELGTGDLDPPDNLLRPH